MKLVADCHIHSNTSPDAIHSVDALCKEAIAKNFKIICLTSHHEIFPGDPTKTGFLLDFPAYDAEIKRAQDKYGGRLEILKGVEFGGPQQHPKEYEELLKMDFDMIIASLHFLPMDYGIHWLWHGNGLMLKECGQYLVERYYDEMVKLTAMGGFQVLAHLDWPKGEVADFREINEINAEVFKNLLKCGAVPEINTMGLTKGYGEFFPSPLLLTQYAEAGGKRITVGSDAHKKESIGAHFEDVSTYLETQNFQVGYFQNKKFIPLEQ